jgi:hypothetical protein
MSGDLPLAVQRAARRAFRIATLRENVGSWAEFKFTLVSLSIEEKTQYGSPAGPASAQAIPAPAVDLRR